jgi:RNA polymerase sigma-70 factor, ECF subfamily
VNAEFATFYEREAAPLVRSLTVVIGEADLAEDAVAEAFARAWSRWPQVRGYDCPRAWVMRVALNVSRTRFRRRAVERRRAPQIARPDEVRDPDPSTSVPLWAAVLGLDSRGRSLIALRYVAGLTQGEIATVLGLPPGTVASGLNRARQKLAETLAPTAVEDMS